MATTARHPDNNFASDRSPLFGAAGTRDLQIPSGFARPHKPRRPAIRLHHRWRGDALRLTIASC
jgi:hypothetical protein